MSFSIWCLCFRSWFQCLLWEEHRNSVFCWKHSGELVKLLLLTLISMIYSVRMLMETVYWHRTVSNCQLFTLTGREWIWKHPFISPPGWRRKPITTTNSSSPGPIRRSARPLYRETCLSSSTSKPLIAHMLITLDQW